MPTSYADMVERLDVHFYVHIKIIPDLNIMNSKMKKRKIKMKPIIVMGTLLLLVTGCKKEDTNPYNGKTTAVFNSKLTYGTMTDQEGNKYKTITIGTQTWMAENLRTTKYNDGTTIPLLENADLWRYSTTGAYCNFNNTTNTDSIATFGRLYNWSVIKTGKLAPIGWHVATSEEWITLITYLGGESIAGSKLRETGTSHWANPNSEATNETGFTGLPGGARPFYGNFYGVGGYAFWWSATEKELTNTAESWILSFYGNGIFSYYGDKQDGYSVRCGKD